MKKLWFGVYYDGGKLHTLSWDGGKTIAKWKTKAAAKKATNRFWARHSLHFFCVVVPHVR